jgi:hypothetical protein
MPHSITSKIASETAIEITSKNASEIANILIATDTKSYTRNHKRDCKRDNTVCNGSRNNSNHQVPIATIRSTPTQMIIYVYGEGVAMDRHIGLTRILQQYINGQKTRASETELMPITTTGDSRKTT